ncbi:MAG TPA: carboxy terminal-processing peptidase, partial [Chthoniobacterales bacterium]
KAEVIDLKGSDGKTYRIGWITLPSFYANMDRSDGSSAKSTTEDVARLLTRLNAEGIEGLVMDLRRDGGGSLEEAIRLTGLFIPSGPVVQAKDGNGRVTVSRDDESKVAYSGPMVVLANRLSASASEIFAAALQDYGRAVVVGDERTFGKGTVQQVIDVGRFMPFFSLAAADAGSLKLTVQKFYRVKGGSTQLNGVASDIVLPSLTDTPEIGESSMPNAMPYDEVAARPIDRFLGHSLYLDELRRRSQERVGQEPEFRYYQDDIARLKKRLEENRISLNKSSREAELAADKKRGADRNAERKARGPVLAATAYELTLDTVEAPKLQQVAFDRKPKRSSYLDAEEEPDAKKEDGAEDIVTPDPIRNEALCIAEDLINLSGVKKTAKANN